MQGGKLEVYRKISFLLSILMIALFTVNVSAKDSEYDCVKEEAVLTGIGILDNDSKETLNTRAGFVKHTLRLMNSEISESKNEKSVFTDVKSDVSALNHAYNIGLINGSDETFRPDDVITSQEAATIMVRALGYGVLMNTYDDYYRQANTLKLFDKANVNMKETELCYEQAVLVMYNFLECDVLKNDLNNQYSKGEEAMTYFLNIYKEKGIVQADETTAIISDAKAGLGQVVIDGDTYETGKVNMKEYLGMSVEFYYKDMRGDYVCLYAEPYGNEILTIDSENILNVGQDFKIEYDTGTRTKTLDMNRSENISIIYNGKRCTNISYDELKVECGGLKFIDNNRDGKYDVLIVESYATYVVKGVDTKNNTIVDYVSRNIIDFDKYDECVMSNDGSEFDISKLSEYDVLNVAASKDSEYAKIIITSDKVNGNIKSKSEDEVKVGDDVYDFSVFWKNREGNSGFEIKMDSVNKLLLNYKGEICYSITSLSSSRYGIICRVSYDDAEDCVYVKLFDREEEMINLEAAEKIKIDSTTYKREARYLKMNEMMTDNSFYGVVPVVYDLDGDGKLKKLTTSADSDWTVLVNNKKRYFSDEAQIWLRGTESIDSPLYGDFASGTSTFYCWIPTDTTQYDNYTVKAHQDLGAIGYKPVTAITLGKSRIADFVLIQEDMSGTVPKVGDSEDLAIVQDKYVGLNDDDEVVDILELYKNGKAVTLKSKKSGDFDEVSEGDVIFYTLNAKGECAGISETYHKGERKIYMNPVNNKGRFSGRADYKEGTVIGAYIDETEGTIYSNLYDRPNVYVVDEKGNVSIGSVDDIFDYETYGARASEIFIQTRYSQVKNVVVYN